MSIRIRTRLRAGFAGGGGGVIPPVSSVAPAITGNAYVGSTLTCSTGTWLNNPTSYSYQWKRGVTNVGTDQNTYVPVTGDIGSTITCTVTATNSAGSASQVSNTTAAVIAVPANTVAPAITGNAYVGSTLTCSTGTWSGGGSQTFAYQWKVGGVNAGTNQNTYVPVTGDIGATVTCTVTASNAAGTGTGAVSNTTAAVIGVPVNTVIPAISGTAEVGQTLTASTGTWTGGGSITYAYQWKSAGSNVGSNQNTYVVQSSDVGNTITVTVTATNAAGTGTPAVSNATSAVPSPFTVWTNVSGMALSNGNLTVTAASTGFARSAAQKSSGKWYFELTFTDTNSAVSVPLDCIGVATAACTKTNMDTDGTNVGALYAGGNVWGNNAFSTFTLAGGIHDGNVVRCAIDLDNERVWFAIGAGFWNGQATGDPATNTLGASISSFSGTTMSPAITIGNVGNATANFGASAFVHAVPSGFTAGWTT